MRMMQQSLGNRRVGQWTAAPAASADVPMIQRQTKAQTPKKAPPITAPLPKEATRKPSGAAGFQAGSANVVAFPEKKSVKPIIVHGQQRDAMTNIRLDWKLPGAKYQDGKVVSITSVPPPTLTIQTIYGPKASPKAKSSYGKGTAREDIQAGKTTLGYHEGSHGAYAVQYLRDNPPPAFAGKVGMSVEAYQEAQAAYDQAMAAYRQALGDYHRVMTDCVGHKEDGCEEPEH